MGDNDDDGKDRGAVVKGETKEETKEEEEERKSRRNRTKGENRMGSKGDRLQVLPSLPCILSLVFIFR